MRYIVVIVIFMIIFLLYLCLWKKTSNSKPIYRVIIRVIALLIVLYIYTSLFFIGWLDSSSHSIKEFYSGYVIDSVKGNPMKNVKVFENITNTENISKTDTNGFFKLKRTGESINDLIFIKEGYKTDTIMLMKNRPIELSSIQYLFLSDDIDTLRMSISK